MRTCFSNIPITALLGVALYLPVEKGGSSYADCPDSAFVSISPTTMTAGSSYRITVKFRNNGTCVWKKGTVKLYATMNSKPGDALWSESIKRNFGLVDEFPGYVITQDIAVNGLATFNFVVDAFPSKGDYRIRYQLVKKPGVINYFGAHKEVMFQVKPK